MLQDLTLLSDRINALSESQTIAMAKKARELAAKGIKVINLSFGEPDFQTPVHIKEAAKKAIDDGYSFYTPVSGYPELRQAIAEKLQRDNGLQWKAENIVVSTGAKQSLANALLCLVNPGDEVIIFSPYWVSYSEMVKLAEGVPVLVEGSVENGFKPSPEQLENAITERTKIVMYSSPCNPTGAIFSKSELEAFARVLEKHEQIFVLADEIYEYIRFEPDFFSMGAIESMRERTVTTNGFSKGFAMTGWRVGYLAAPKWLADACDKMQGQVTSGTCSIAQRAALAAYSDMQPTHEMRDAFLKRRDLIVSELQKIPGLKVPSPQGAFYVFPDVSAYFGKAHGENQIHSAEDLAMYLLNEAHVSTVTGEAFGSPDCLRISFAASTENLITATQKIAEALEKLL
jgi:aspartate aminotransferase